MTEAKTILIFLLSAVAEITGCYLTFTCLREGKPLWYLLPAVGSLCAFALLLSLQTGPAGRTYAAYGGIYIATSLVWMWKVERLNPDKWDLLGTAISLLGMAIIAFSPRR
jgi:small multidrug resistance family-3 protein